MELMTLFGLPLGMPIVTFTLITEGALLFVAAQTGFVDGPRVLASMATDRWLAAALLEPERAPGHAGRRVGDGPGGGDHPGRHARERQIAGRTLRHQRVHHVHALAARHDRCIGGRNAARASLVAQDTDQRCRRHVYRADPRTDGHAEVRSGRMGHGGDDRRARRAVHDRAFALSARAKGHRTAEADILPEIFAAAEKAPAERDPNAPTAVLLVNGFNGMGLATLTTVQRLFGSQFHNVVFVGVAEIDSACSRDPNELKHLEQQIADDMVEYCRFAADLGFHPELRTGIGPDVVVELQRLCLEVAHEFPHSVFFAGKLIFTEELDGFVSASCTTTPRSNFRTAAGAWVEPGDPAGARGTVAGAGGEYQGGERSGRDSGLAEVSAHSPQD